MAEVVETQNVLKGRIVYVPEIDKTLTKDGYSADAKVTGDKINLLAEVIKNIEGSGLGLATGVLYDNKNSGFEAETVQSAIDELLTFAIGLVKTVSDNLSSLSKDTLRKSEGGMVEGTLMVRNTDNGYGSVMKNHSSTVDYGTQLADVSKDGKTAKVTVNATANMLTYTDADDNISHIMHEGNKGFGSYSGNGSASARTISTKGIGRLLLVYCSTYQAFITPKGAFVIDLSKDTFSWLDSAKANYLNGTLTLNTNNDVVNKYNETYYYQVI